MLMEQAAPYRPFHAPREDGGVLVDPSWSAMGEVVAQNRQHLAALKFDLQGRSFSELARDARRELLQRAHTYTAQYQDLPDRGTDDLSMPLLLSGHQPQLFHPGVWYKNFVLGRLAHQLGGVGIHLLIDSDLCRSTSVRVPTGTVERPRLEMVDYDRFSMEVPYEQRLVRDEAMFKTFPARVSKLLEPLGLQNSVGEPMVRSLWSSMERLSGGSMQETNLGLRLAQGRHRVETGWGNETLELPQSAVCQLPTFHWFMAHLLANLPRFWGTYNDALSDYRQAHRLRNQAQPMPDLTETDGWLEGPFWIWTDDDPTRRPLFARQQGNEIEITDRHQQKARLTLSADRDAGLATEQLEQLAKQGIKIRTRALATTLFARLFLGDLFLHGIGGAKYDQVTNTMAQQFFGFPLPPFATISATLRLPVEHEAVPEEQHRTLRKQLRELTYHPERRLSQEDPEVARFMEEKRHWSQMPKTRENARQRHEAIARANRALQPHVAEHRARLERQRKETQHHLRANAILDSREYAFCLFPEETLKGLVLDEN